MIPEGWKIKKISECLERVVDPVIPEAEKLYRQIGIRSHAKGIFHKEPVTGKSLGNKRVFNVHPNCFVVNIVFAWEQAIAKTTDAEQGMIASHRFPMFKPRESLCDIDYINYVFKSSLGKYLLELASPGGAGRNKTLGQDKFSKIKLTLPPLSEQKEIAKILSIWDRAIYTIQALINVSKQHKKALMQQLLTGKKRFTGFEEDWSEKALSSIAIFRRGSFPQPYGNPEWIDEVNGHPFVQVYDIGRNMQLKPDTKVKISDVAISKSVFIPKGTVIVSIQGSIGRVAITQYDAYVDRTILLFQEFKIPMDKVFFASVLLDLFEIEKAKAPGGTIKTITKQVLSGFKIRVPFVEEQRKIALVISNADKEIRTLQGKLGYLKSEKKSLMQQLLTGKRRVKIDKFSKAKGSVA